MDYVDSKVSGLGYELCSTVHHEKMRGGETGLEEKMISILDVLSLKYLWDMCEEKHKALEQTKSIRERRVESTEIGRNSI